MSKSGSLSSVPTKSGDDRYSVPSTEAKRAPHRGRGRRERRFEIGFFLRKTVNGWLEYYKLFPPTARRTSEDHSQPQALAATATPEAFETQQGDSLDGPVTQASTHPPKNDDPGPGTETRYEAGLVLRVVEEPGDSEEDDGA